MKRILAVILPLFICSGCFLVPIIDSFSSIGVTAGDREKLLPARIKSFQDALYWGTPGAALKFVQPDQRDLIKSDLRKVSKEARLVESKVSDIDFQKDSYEATVTISVRMYRMSTLIIKENEEEQHWKFSVADGWLLVSRKDISE